MDFTSESIGPLLLTQLFGLVTLAVWVGVLVLALMRFSFTRQLWRRALPLALAITALAVPMNVVGLKYFDPSALLGDFADQMPQGFFAVMFYVTSILGIVIALAHNVIKFPVAVLAGGSRPPFPLLSGATTGRFDGWLIAAGSGLVLGIASTALFLWQDVEGNSFMQEFAQKAYPGLDYSAPWLLYGCMLPAMVAAALAEELLFRGVIQRWLARWLQQWMGEGVYTLVIAIGVTSLVWAIGHAMNTDALFLKLGQIFLVGLLFGWFCHRFSVECSMIGHVTFNVTIMLATLVV